MGHNAWYNEPYNAWVMGGGWWMRWRGTQLPGEADVFKLLSSVILLRTTSSWILLSEPLSLPTPQGRAHPGTSVWGPLKPQLIYPIEGASLTLRRQRKTNMLRKCVSTWQDVLWVVFGPTWPTFPVHMLLDCRNDVVKPNFLIHPNPTLDVHWGLVALRKWNIGHTSKKTPVGGVVFIVTIFIFICFLTHWKFL
jgi:hypothetical protein